MNNHKQHDELIKVLKSYRDHTYVLTRSEIIARI